MRFLAAALLLALPAGALERPLTWSEAVDLALRRNPELAAAREGLDAARSRRYGTLNSLLPSLSVSARQSDSKGATGSSRYGTDASVSLDVFDLRTYGRVGASSAALRRARADLRARSAELRLGLRRAWTQLAFAQEQLIVAEKVRELRARNAELVALKYASGRESKGNKLRSEAELAEARAAASAAGRALRAARVELARRLGLDGYEPLSAGGPLDLGPLPSAPAESVLLAHPAVAQREAARDSARSGLTEARGAFLPNLSASYSRGYVGRTYFPERDSWTASAVLSLPLFAGGPTAALHSASAAKSELARAEEDLRAARDQVRSELESAWAALNDSAEALDVQRAFLEAARQRNEEASVRYSSGLMTFENWEIIVSELVSSERGWVRARRDAVLAEAQWDQARGLGLGDDL